MPLENALEEALKKVGNQSAIVAAGSLFIAAAVREIWQKKDSDNER
jgi:folylpolyglutamate synthase/dihydropteroate synthase